ncbi:MauE/DoxX family redox-associated membrane protein [Streptomyces sp. Ru72]|uniref:MauE/DoxX family redox-associated membrane protein n=1 Tax=Streptomyces sp. Ru72 TaxID=2080747 RepID=UPI000CDE329B|nr:MauE/DoxX family redox-associated membrane protein [Streptomyces sp. Ru72]POX48558.1 methylamine utilization protein MauE [Streptomyces sp. Ru72]
MATAFLTVCHILVAVVFAASAVGKARPAGFRAFLTTLADMGLGTPGLRRPLAYATITAEGVAAGLLLLPGTRAGVIGLLLASLVLAVLTIGVVRTVRRGGPPVTCACFGRTGRPLGVLHLVRNSGLLLAAVGALVVTGSGPGRAAGGELVVSVAAGAVLAVVVIGLDDIADLFTAPTASTTRATDLP